VPPIAYVTWVTANGPYSSRVQIGKFLRQTERVIPTCGGRYETLGPTQLSPPACVTLQAWGERMLRLAKISRVAQLSKAPGAQGSHGAVWRGNLSVSLSVVGNVDDQTRIFQDKVRCNHHFCRGNE